MHACRTSGAFRLSALCPKTGWAMVNLATFLLFASLEPQDSRWFAQSPAPITSAHNQPTIRHPQTTM